MIARIRPETRYAHLFRSLFTGADYKYRLEEELKDYFGVAEVLLTEAGRVGLYYLLKALPQKRVYLPAYTCWAVPEAVRLAGKEPVYVDIRLNDYNMDVARLAEQLVPDSIILATHQFGIPCDIEAILALAGERNCLVLEDNAAGFGSTYNGEKTGRFGSAGILSFEYSKVLCCGKGGAILFNDADLYARVKQLHDRDVDKGGVLDRVRPLLSLFGYLLLTAKPVFPLTHKLFSRAKGETTGYPGEEPGAPARHYLTAFDNLRGTLAYHGMLAIDTLAERRKEIADFYLNELQESKTIDLPDFPDDKSPVFMRFPVRVKTMEKQRFYEKCVSAGVDLAFTFSYSCAADADAFPGAHRAAKTVLNLPLYSRLTRADVEKVRDVILAI